MKLSIEGRTALVTGASRGIGADLVKRLIDENVTVVGVARKSDSFSILSSSLIGSNFIPIELDLMSLDAVSELVTVIKEKNLSPDIIINNVGGTLGVTDPLAPYSDYEKLYRFNLGISIDINREFIPDMQKRKWGRICHISSISALENQGPPTYSAAKAALNAYVRGTSRFLAAENVVLNSVMPGAIFTEGGYWDSVKKERPEHLQNYLAERMATKRLGELSEISNLVMFLVSEHASFMIGSNVLADGGQGRLFEQN
jgi:3-oxoacyl-[acyl-carrier protein] reductase